MTDEPIYGVIYLRENLRVICFVGQHTAAVVFSYLTLLFIGIGFPLGLFLLLSRATAVQISDPSFREAYGFLFRGYRAGPAVSSSSKED